MISVLNDQFLLFVKKNKIIETWTNFNAQKFIHMIIFPQF